MEILRITSYAKVYGTGGMRRQYVFTELARVRTIHYLVLIKEVNELFFSTLEGHPQSTAAYSLLYYFVFYAPRSDCYLFIDLLPPFAYFRCVGQSQCYMVNGTQE